MTTRIRQLPGVIKRTDLFHIDPRTIIVQDGWNPRTDFTGEDDLMNSIIENGVRVPLRLKRGENDEKILIDGERRLRATLKAIDSGHDIAAVPCIFERTGISEMESLFLALLANDGKRLDPIEEAEAFRRFTAWGLTPNQIGKRIGKSGEFVRQRLTLIDAAPDIKTAVQKEEISIKQAAKIVTNSNGDIDKQKTALTQAPKKHARKQRRKPIEIVMDDYVLKMTNDELWELAKKLKMEMTKRENPEYASSREPIDLMNKAQGASDGHPLQNPLAG